MKDAFGKKIDVGDKVLYSTKTGAGTTYVIGVIVEKLLCKHSKNSFYTPPDRVRIKPTKLSTRRHAPATQPVLYASNVVKM